MRRADLMEAVEGLDDGGFDRVYPPDVRALSGVHWTPVAVAVRAARFLVRTPGTRVLDIGCGPGKFCIVGALATPGRFTGVEQRRRLWTAGRSALERAGAGNVELVHGDVRAMDFTAFDAFYLFNPFAELAGTVPSIDGSVIQSASEYRAFTEFVSGRLASAPSGTRVATYFGLCEEIPSGYACVGTEAGGELRLWEKG